MTKTLLDILKTSIVDHGPMSVSTYMNYALAHPQHGYYMSGDPFGVEGDFTTAPEISQIFGELIGAWFADLWIQSGQPKDFVLAEFGPGRGTLASDILRATKNIPGFHDALSLHLVETSPSMREAQAQSLGAFQASWHDDISTVPDDRPFFCLGNEFLDALPVKQIQKQDGKWFERVIHINENEELCFGLGSEVPAPEGEILNENAKNGAVYEFSPLRDQYMTSICEKLDKQGGAALFIDYGYLKDQCGDTLQAVKNHAYTDVLSGPGAADLTAHVDFSAIEHLAGQHGLAVSGPVYQRGFLLSLGLRERLYTLLQNAKDDQAKLIKSGADRLVNPKDMGTLFKVIALHKHKALKPAGFHET